MENLKLFLSSFVGVPISCTCYVERQDDGTIVEPDLNLCVFVRSVHKAAIERATERLQAITKGGE